MVVSPDLGNTKRSRNFAEALDAPLAIIEKRRVGNEDHSEVLNLIGSVDGCQVVIVDDEIDTAGSITQAAEVCFRTAHPRSTRPACTPSSPVRRSSGWRRARSVRWS